MPARLEKIMAHSEFMTQIQAGHDELLVNKFVNLLVNKSWLTKI